MTGKSTNASSSSSIYSGCPSPITYFADLFLDLENHLARIVGGAMIDEEKRIKKSLSQKEEGWKDISKDFSIKWDPKNLSFIYTVKGASKKKAAALEYGPPAKSLLRHEILSANKTMGKAIDIKIKTFLGDSV